ncbi:MULTISPECIES: peptide chain release factor N(5)-glutamine methyltransferase [Methylomonas]|uniref:Release factor glutamine methyltransferase n=2 Tax=Methylomonas TaxID=416 RepID=A0A126T6N3_9GAMM|nr:MULTISPECIES: peptide chain release factor N(5)-glutamine methyltransferase [Methylomonas]AMK77690.1 protein-(glutamine-N5) methyltransferase, release factor-specific [Methylomonas denitrificans]OAH96818.1 protein-(glutamine-N5) methyltransferase, release factor-specific [Methylomonas methanica]TCV86864.1 [protein release factor]-glutamine N5-methyltransferase [Methylomonas methanica]
MTRQSVIANPPPQKNSSHSIQSLLDTASGQLSAASETAMLDAEVLLCHCLDKTRSFLRAWPEHQPSPHQIAQFQLLVEQRSQGTPVAYLTGQREFWSRNFKVSPDVLIPRPDTELLIELSLALLPKDRPGKIIDLGTGSGIIAITLAVERPLAQVFASDLSSAALDVAQYNAQQLNTSNISFLQSHWFDNIQETGFDLVLSNPPYIADNDPHLHEGDVRFEPASALISPENGLRDIRLLAEQARLHLKDNGQLLVEHGYNQQTEVQAIFNEFGYQKVNTYADLSGNPRVTSGIWEPL